MIKDKIPAYITWEQYERNQRQLAANGIQGIGVPRKGSALLSGLVICGRCGIKMATRYSSSTSRHTYLCGRMASTYGGSMCQSLIGTPLDDLIVGQVLSALEPSALDVSLRVAEDIEQERRTLVTHWEKQLERANYEVERAYRQYNASEPENRLVTRTLEKKWEEALATLEKLKYDHSKFLAEQPSTLSEKERDSIRALASNIPALWSLATTTVEERQESIRLLIERIFVAIEGKTEKVSVEVQWSGGHKTSSMCIRPVAKFEHLSYYNELLNRAATLRNDGHEFSEIADTLNEEGWRPPKWCKGFTRGEIGPLLARAGIVSHKKRRVDAVERAENEWTFRDLSQKTAVPEPTLYSYMKKGMLQARRATGTSHGGIWLITADEKEIKRLRDLKSQPKEWIYSSRVKKVN